MQLIREFHCKRYDQIANTPCSSNPVGFTQGGLYKGTKELTDPIGYDIVKSFTASFGITALNELNVLMEGKMLHQSDRKEVNVVIDYIIAKINLFKKEDGWLYAAYNVPAESLSSTQLNQFKAKFGVIKDVSDREYFSNGFHLHVSADVTPFEKQDMEEELFHKLEGGHIQYTRFNNPSNTEAIKNTILRGMSKGFYSGVNFDLVICENCGHRPDGDVEVCTVCGSHSILAMSRVCGYISYRKVGGDTRFNDGKLAEIRDRVSM
jgi:ribonucleoside-triphosphate reductase